MARIRSIKIDFWENEILAQLPPHARLLFPALWCLADKDGRLEDRPAKLRAKVFGYETDIDMEDLLVQLACCGFIQRYEVEGKRYIQVANWLKHQRPNPKETGLFPAPEGEHNLDRETFTNKEEEHDLDRARSCKKEIGVFPGKDGLQDLDCETFTNSSHASIPHTPLPKTITEGGSGGKPKVSKYDFEDLTPEQRVVADRAADAIEENVGPVGKRIIAERVKLYPNFDFDGASADAMRFYQEKGQRFTVSGWRSKVDHCHDWAKYQRPRGNGSGNGHAPFPVKHSPPPEVRSSGDETWDKTRKAILEAELQDELGTFCDIVLLLDCPLIKHDGHCWVFDCAEAMLPAGAAKQYGPKLLDFIAKAQGLWGLWDPKWDPVIQYRAEGKPSGSWERTDAPKAIMPPSKPRSVHG